ncbi:hypothetical protein [Coleofasciculus chthonoplastes]|uniref:hypothetical protein n=1 Tax=Coleofasciculus chthonoplastes TaxID=64178 RepID=UPI0032FC671E
MATHPLSCQFNLYDSLFVICHWSLVIGHWSFVRKQGTGILEQLLGLFVTINLWQNMFLHWFFVIER